MAIVRELVTESGCRVAIADDCCRDLDPVEIKRRRAEVWREICRIARSAAERREHTKDDAGGNAGEAAPGRGDL